MKNINNLKNKTNNMRGFTMIELLVVIVILGILSVIGLGSFSAAQVKSRDSNRKSSLDEIATALEVYYNDYGSYPTSSYGNIAGCGNAGTDTCSYGNAWEDDNNTVYMVQLPEDPGANSFYYVSDGESYYLYARLENVNDGSVPLSGGEPGVYSSVSDECGGEGCNYGIASSNTTLGTVDAD